MVITEEALSLCAHTKRSYFPPYNNHKVTVTTTRASEIRFFRMLVPASVQMPHTIRPVANFGLHRRYVLNSDRCSRLRESGMKMILSKCKVLESSNGAPSGGLVKKRKIAEHIILLRAKPNISDVEEKDMLDYLYTSQYQMRGILAVSLGRIEDPNSENFTHAVFMRFQQIEDIAKFQSSPYYFKILDEHVKPVSYGSVSVDFESEVEDDIIPLFRRGEGFNYGVEFMLLISFLETASREAVEDALACIQKLISQCSSLIVQATFGCCLNHTDNGYSYAAVIRFPSFDDLKLFRESNEYNDMWASKLHPIVEKSLQLHFTVDPVGNQLM